MLQYFTHAEISIFLAILTPTVSFCALNQRFFATRQIAQSILLAGLSALLGAGIVFMLTQYLQEFSFILMAQKQGVALISALVAALSTTLFLLLHERFFTENIPNIQHRRKVIMGIYVFFIASSALYSTAVLNSVLFIIFLFSLFDAYKKRKDEKQIVFEPRLQNLHYIAQDKQNITLQQKPNIYFLLLESYHSAKAMKKLYDIDDTVIDELFQKHGFTDYKNYFSNRLSTTPNVQALFNYQLTPSKKNRALALEILRENDYSCEFFDTTYFVFGKYMAKNEFASFYLTSIQHILHTLFCPLFAQSSYLRKITKSADPFNVNSAASFADIFLPFRHRVSVKQDKPRFLTIRFGANHNNVNKAWQPGDHFTQSYKDCVEKGQKEIIDLVNHIARKDPHGLIIAVGDHGSMRHANVWVGTSAAEAMTERGVSMEELALDLFSVRCNIRWPHPPPTQELFSHVQLFPTIFQYLGADPKHFSAPEANISILPCDLIAVREGKILSELEKYDADASIYQMFSRYKQSTASIQDCLHLAERLESWQAAEVLAWGSKTYPESSEITLQHGHILFQSGNIKEGLGVTRSIAQHYKNEEITLCYAKQLLEVAPEQALTFLEKAPYHTSSADLCFVYACASLQLGHEEKALEYVDIILNKHKNNYNHHYYACCILLTLKKYSQACEVSNTLFHNINETHMNNMYLELATLCYILDNQWDLAKQINKKARDFRTGTSWNWIFYAHILEKQKKLDAAFQSLVKATSEAKNNVHIYQALGRFAITYGIDDEELTLAKAYAHKEIENMAKAMLSSGVIDKTYYLKNTPNVQGNPYSHYLSSGFYQGFDFAPWFNSILYLFLNPPLFWAGVNPYEHFFNTGIQFLQNPSLLHYPRKILSQNPKMQQSMLKDKKLLLHTMKKTWEKN